MMDQPFFDRWRAKLIATLEPAGVGELDTIRFAPVAPNVAVVCPFLRFDGEQCEQLITYYLHVGSGVEDDLSCALGACHRHLGQAFDVLFLADRLGLADACDDDAVDASTSVPAARAPVPAEDAALAERLRVAGIATAVDFGTTALHEGYSTVTGAHVALPRSVAAALRERRVLELAADLGIEIAPAPDGGATLTTPQPDGAEEWIAQNRALRELLRDVLEGSVDPIGYRYRTIADALPELVAFEPRIYTSARSGSLEVRTRIAATPAERTWVRDVEAGRRQTLALFVDRLPRPGDYLDVTFARYRFVRVWSDGAAYGAETVLERVKQPSRN
ncbi:MAG: hypothetical protein ABSH03_02545 [Candidatus Lustribacter sp.]|jgi:hypothetical protein